MVASYELVRRDSPGDRAPVELLRDPGHHEVAVGALLLAALGEVLARFTFRPPRGRKSYTPG